MSLFVVRHKKTKNLLPVEYTKGASRWEGRETCYVPRIFESKVSVNNFVKAWARGVAKKRDPEGTGEWLSYEKRGRSTSDLEIFSVVITLGERI